MEPVSDHHQGEEDEELTLSAATQAVLAEFLAEKEEKEVSLPDDSEGPISIDSFPEDWQVLPPVYHHYGQQTRKLRFSVFE
jgi:hypothetical protein